MSKEYDDLRKIWYAKLKNTKFVEAPKNKIFELDQTEETKFNDIEQSDGNLKIWSSRFRTPAAVRNWKTKSSYYYMANHFLTEHKFINKTEKLIWEYHANGASIRNIVKILKTKLTDKQSAKYNRNDVWEIIKRLSNIMKKTHNSADDDF